MHSRILKSLLAAGLLLPLGFPRVLNGADRLVRGFQAPPPAARPWVYWFWLNGNITSNGITADLEAMHRAGIGGVLIMEVDQGSPKGSAGFAGPQWRDLFKFMVSEASRLGLEVNMNNDAGWCGSGGPWITPALSMQKLVWTETPVQGPSQFDAPLPQPKALANYYRDIAVLAIPAPADPARIHGINSKAVFSPVSVSLASPAVWPSTPPDQTIPRGRTIDLTSRLGSDGRIKWEVPEGRWMIVRLGHTPTGQNNHPSPADGRGLECDKLSKPAAKAMFDGLMGKLIADVGPLAGKTLVATHIDSWEVGVQNWTPRLREEFQRLRGYDLWPFLPVITGRVVDSLEISERFLWDLRQTISELLLENYAGEFRRLAHRHGMRLSIEAYNTCPTDELAYAGRADEPMGEFWSWSKYGAAFSCTEMASAAHVYGKPIVGAEAFTATDAEKWLGHPGNIKDLGDWAFCEGINRFVFHRYALQPWDDRPPGMSMGPWGLHYERTQTWWEQSSAWHRYLARCQFLLQQGLFVADICLLGPEGSPQSLNEQQFARGHSGEPLERPGYNFDLCPPEVVLTRMRVKNGRLVLPDGMSYQLLVLPRTRTMTPPLLRKIKSLVEAGATVVGARPLKSPSLSDFPKCDQEIAALADQLWGRSETPTDFAEHRVGKGRMISGRAFEKDPELASASGGRLGSAKWIWRKEGNPVVAVPPGKRYFRRVITTEPGRRVASARLVMTADNSFECWINGRQAGAGDNFARTYSMDVISLLRPGTNLVAVTAVNGATAPNPAGLIALLTIRYTDGREQEIRTDQAWEAASAVPATWPAEAAEGEWAVAMELGSLGMAPWGDVEQALSDTDIFPDLEAIARVLAKLGVRPDFTSKTAGLRYIHRNLDGADVYFVANKQPQSVSALCDFRVAGRRPEFWWPDTGRIESAAVYEDAEGAMRVPIQFEPSGSVFVLFRPGKKAEADRIISVTRNGEPLLDATGQTRPEITSSPIDVMRDDGRLETRISQPGQYVLTTAKGQRRQLAVNTIAGPLELAGPWEVRFAPGRGAPAMANFEKLISWSEHSDPGVKYFSGAATYRKTLSVSPDQLGKNRRLVLDLGEVAVTADVFLNRKNLGTLWKKPFRLDVTDTLKAGENSLEVRVVNLWINRQIGDEQLPEDSARNPNGTLKSWPAWLEEGKPSPAGRYTFTSWRLWKKDSPLAPSGLLGPVRLETIELRQIP